MSETSVCSEGTLHEDRSWAVIQVDRTPYRRLRREKGIIVKRRLFLLGLNLILLAVVLFPTGKAMAACDTPPACQCECLDEWDRCAEGMSTEEARKKCDPDYDECYEENCFW